jgi:ATP-binding cassette subfamily B protein
MKLLQESLGGMREIILDNSHEVFERRLMALQREARRLRTLSNFIQAGPRFVVESAGIALIALLSIHFSRQPGGIVAAIPVLGALALGAQRLLPLVQAIYLGWTSYSVNCKHLADVLKLMRVPVRANGSRGTAAERPFSQLELRRLCFKYGKCASTLALKDIDLVIARGERIGLIGKTGSGKSTLADVLMGLLLPTSGEMRIDGVVVDEATVAGWQAQIAHVPQAIFLADDTIAANIAFGVEGEPDNERVRQAAERANLRGFIEQLPEGVMTRVGERGVRLSGGQRQRIGIARALYKKATLLVLDEATSAVDHETEAAIMESVASLDRDLTIILIAHRLTTLAGCDVVYRLDGGSIVESGTYKQVVLGRGGALRSSNLRLG